MSIHSVYCIYEVVIIKKQLICTAAVLAVIFISLGVISVRYFMTRDQAQLYAYIYSDEELIEVIDLNAVTEPYTVTVGDEENGYNIIEVRNGSIGVIEASCPDGVCINTGFIDSSLIPVVCLPNKLVIEIKSEGDYEESFDAVAE